MTLPNKPLDKFFNESTDSLSGNYTLLDFTRTMDGHQVVNDDATQDIELSYNGGIIHNEIKAGEAATFDLRRRNKIYLRVKDNVASGISYRVSAWMTS